MSFKATHQSAAPINWKQVKSWLPKRKRDANKGDYGHVLVIGGDEGMGGAVLMAAEAALRVGVGLVSVATRHEQAEMITAARPEIMCHAVEHANDLDPLLSRASFIVIGPGLGKTEWAKALLNKVLQAKQPKLLDADALNLLSEQPEKKDDWILTPHPGEAGRLLHVATAEIQADRFKAAKALQQQYGGVIVLKGAGSIIQGEKTALCRAGNPGMASGGMGDALSGIIGGLVAQGLSLTQAAEAGVFIHAAAGDRAAKAGGERGLLATDLIAELRHFVNPD